MTSTTRSRSDAARDEGPEDMAIRVWPLGDRGLHAYLAVGAVAATAVAVFWATGREALGAIAGLAVAAALWRVFLPITYEITSSGVIAHIRLTSTRTIHRRRIAWMAVGRVEIRAAGLLLLPQAAVAPADALRGLFLPWQGRRRELLQFVRRHALLATFVEIESAR